uniref:Putative ovule protein n=1 Tax=Solanum chacoense TaxID=4108 RepID=A0A0V0HGA7_SOLCH
MTQYCSSTSLFLLQLGIFFSLSFITMLEHSSKELESAEFTAADLNNCWSELASNSCFIITMLERSYKELESAEFSAADLSNCWSKLASNSCLILSNCLALF